MSPEEQLDAFIARFTPVIAADAHAVLDRMRRRLTGAIELVYDNFNALVVGFCPSERASEAPLSIVVNPRRISLCFLQGAALEDPDGLLVGDGKQVRRIVLDRPEDLDGSGVQALIDRALAKTAAWDNARPRAVEVRAVAARRRPRRPGM
jgi:hypothetical protein